MRRYARRDAPGRSLKLWKYNEASGQWEYQRNVEPDTADGWLQHFQKHEPRSRFKISATRPAKTRTARPKRASIVGRLAYVRRHIPGHPVGIPTDAMVDVLEERKSRGAPIRYRVDYRGHSYWVDEDALRLPQ